MSKIEFGPHLEEYKSMQGRLIPANIAVIVIAVAAMLCQFFLPLVHVTVTLDAAELSPYLTDYIIEAADSAAEEDPDSVWADINIAEYSYIVDDVLENVDDIRLTADLKPTQLLSVAFGGGDALVDYIADLIPTYAEVEAYLYDITEAAVPAALALIMDAVVDAMVSSMGEEYESFINVIYADVRGMFDSLEQGNNYRAQEIYEGIIDDIFDSLVDNGQMTEGDWDNYHDTLISVYENIVELCSDENGVFSYVTLLDNLDAIIDYVSGVMEDNGVTLTLSATPAAYAAVPLADEEETAGDAESAERATVSSVEDFFDLLDNPVPYLRTAMESYLSDEDAASLTKEIAAMSFAVFVGIPMFVWLIQAIFALCHIFMKDKRTGMWYTKIVGIGTFLLFVALPTVAVSYASTFIELISSWFALSSEVTDILYLCASSLGFGFGGAGMWTLLLYVLLWCVSVFMCFPTKRRMRALYKRDRRERADAKGVRRAADREGRGA